uniref:Uncharacterized protein n=1 Tax=Candidatus Kentrum sp. UNK TaxID=2126344 RepID=A0A451A8U7_9GAMM|nr:MAG: hypothetical protein BECKUNK1418G_GA0071005_102423 [Candidatus Kentron sp. UNK]
MMPQTPTVDFLRYDDEDGRGKLAVEQAYAINPRAYQVFLPADPIHFEACIDLKTLQDLLRLGSENAIHLQLKSPLELPYPFPAHTQAKDLIN